MYEPLEHPTEFPKIIPSPSTVIKWQRGDCFDMSILLVSLLIGVGYDAYCVIGLAPKEITLKNESLMENPYLNEGLEKKDSEMGIKKLEPENPYLIDPDLSKLPVSRFLTDKAEKEIRDKEEEERKANDLHDDDEPDRTEDDPFTGRRLHCWVLIKKGKREMTENIFIEPSTGRNWPVTDPGSSYTRIYQIFNNQNFWINLYPQHNIKDLVLENMDNGEEEEWEYVMLDTIKFPNLEKEGGVKPTKKQTYEDLNESDSSQSDQEEKEQKPKITRDLEVVRNTIEVFSEILDMPLPWPPKLYIDRESFIKGSPLGQLTKYFKRSRVDLYTKYSQVDGLSKRIVIYEDLQRTLIKEIRCLYQHRRNNLIMRRRYPKSFKTIEYYRPNDKPLISNQSNQQPWPHWKEIHLIDRQERIIKYYPYRFDDGLMERREYIFKTIWDARREISVEINKTEEFYEGRDDYLEYRSFLYKEKPENEIAKTDYLEFDSYYLGGAHITLMEQRFGKNTLQPSKDQVARMVKKKIKNRL